VTKWVVAAAYASAGFTTAANFNSLANGSCVVAPTALTNSTNLYVFGDVSFVVTVGGTTLATSYFDLYILPLNQDGSTYGDNTATGTTAPSLGYRVSSVNVMSGITTGNTVVGTFRSIVIPPQNFKFAIVNNLGIALSSTASATIDVVFYDINQNA
jgi:hypothetical protein